MLLISWVCASGVVRKGTWREALRSLCGIESRRVWLKIKQLGLHFGPLFLEPHPDVGGFRKMRGWFLFVRVSLWVCAGHKKKGKTDPILELTIFRQTCVQAHGQVRMQGRGTGREQEEAVWQLMMLIKLRWVLAKT